MISFCAIIRTEVENGFCHDSSQAMSYFVDMVTFPGLTAQEINYVNILTPVKKKKVLSYQGMKKKVLKGFSHFHTLLK